MTNTLTKNLRTQYLSTMGIQVWVRRHIISTLTAESSSVNISTMSHESTNITPENTSSVSEPPATLQPVTANVAPPLPDESPIEPPTEAALPPDEKPPPVPQPTTVNDTPPPLPLEDRPVSGLDWRCLQTRVAICTACDLHKTRTQTVFGIGNRQAELLLIGEGPGADEDAQGEPFVGRAGQLLNEMLYAINLKREDVYIANVVKCRPPNNRNPNSHELACCNAFLQRQMALVNPKLIVAVGRVAAHHLLATDTAIGKLREQRFKYGETSIPLIATYHPAYLLRFPQEKRKSWHDLQFISQTLAELKT